MNIRWKATSNSIRGAIITSMFAMAVPTTCLAELNLPKVPQAPNPVIKNKIDELESAARLMFSLKSSASELIKGGISPVVADRKLQVDTKIGAALQVYGLLINAYPEKFRRLVEKDRKLIALAYAGSIKPRRALSSRIKVKPESDKPDKDGLFAGKAYTYAHTEYTIVNISIPAMFKQAMSALEAGKMKYASLSERATLIENNLEKLEKLSTLLANSTGDPENLAKNQTKLMELCDKIEGDLRRLAEDVSKPETAFSAKRLTPLTETQNKDQEQNFTYSNFEKKWNEYWKDYLDLVRIDTQIQKISEDKYKVTAHIHPAKDAYAGQVIVRLASGNNDVASTPYSGTKFPITGLPKPETDDDMKKRLQVIHFVETHQPALKIRLPNQKPRYATLYGIGIDEGPFCNKPNKSSWSAEKSFLRFWKKSDATRIDPPVCYGEKQGQWNDITGITVTYTTNQNPVGNKRLLPKVEMVFTPKDL